MTVGDLMLLVELAAPLFMVGVFWAMQIAHQILVRPNWILDAV